MKLLVLALAGLLGAASIAHADDGGDRRAERRQRMLERFDTNHDGRLDRRERRQAKQMRRQNKLRRFDRNGDGWIDARDRALPPRAPAAPMAPDQE